MELVLIWLFFYLPLCIAVAMLAARYRRSSFGWFVLSVLFSPLLGFAFVLAAGPRTASSVPAQRVPCKRVASPLSNVPPYARARGMWS